MNDRGWSWKATLKQNGKNTVGQSAKTSALSLEEECERMGLPWELIRHNPGLRGNLMTLLILEPLAKWFASAWRNLSNEQLAQTFWDFDSGFVVKASSPLLSADSLSSVPLLAALRLSIVYEYERRVLTAETSAGTLLRKLAATGRLSKKGFTRLQGAQPWQRYNPEGKEENSSCFILALMEKLAAAAVPSLSSREGLLKFLSGWLNNLPAEADGVLRAEVEKNKRRRRILAANKELAGSSFLSQGLKIRFRQQDAEQKVLLAEIRSLKSLTVPERKVIELTLQDFNQDEIAGRLGVTQAYVSQLKSSAMQKVRNAVVPS